MAAALPAHASTVLGVPVNTLSGHEIAQISVKRRVGSVWAHLYALQLTSCLYYICYLNCYFHYESQSQFGEKWYHQIQD